MTDEPILLSGPDVGLAERTALLDAFDSGWIAPVGPDLDAFEAELRSYCGAEAAVAVSSGTAALQLALVVAGVGEGDEVVVQSSTFAASAFAVVHAGATPVFCDSESATWCMDPDLLDDFLSARARVGRVPKAVMPVDLFGSTADYPSLLEVCDRFEVELVRDAAESLGSVSTVGPVGALGRLTALSFNGNKIITTSSGGALLGDPDTVARVRHLATQARQPLLHYEHLETGFNYRLSNLLAALGRAQLRNIEAKIERRQEVNQSYVEAFPGFSWCPFEATVRPNHWLSVALVPNADPLELCRRLNDRAVGARPGWKPMHQQPVFAGCEWVAGQGVADDLFARGICLPSGSALTDAEVGRVIAAVRECLQDLAS